MITDTQEQASAGLKLNKYHFKWKRAKYLASLDNTPSHLIGPPYWELVRALYLELGGARNATN